MTKAWAGEPSQRPPQQALTTTENYAFVPIRQDTDTPGQTGDPTPRPPTPPPLRQETEEEEWKTALESLAPLGREIALESATEVWQEIFNEQWKNPASDENTTLSPKSEREDHGKKYWALPRCP